MTVAEMLGRMSSRELAEWQAYFTVENEDALKREMEIEADRKLRGL